MGIKPNTTTYNKRYYDAHKHDPEFMAKRNKVSLAYYYHSKHQRYAIIADELREAMRKVNPEDFPSWLESRYNITWKKK